jgi:hypothetical protein
VSEYFDQCQLNMKLLGLKLAHLISYDPRYKEGTNLLICNVPICPDWQKKFDVRYELFEKAVAVEIELQQNSKTYWKGSNLSE